MKFDDVERIIRVSKSDDWISCEDKGSFTFREDLALRIQRRDIDFNSIFDEPWAKCHANTNAHKVIYDVFYNNSFVKTVTLVSVDGGRATIPMPEMFNFKTIMADDYHFAKIVSPERLDEYIQRSGLIIPKLEEKD